MTDSKSVNVALSELSVDGLQNKTSSAAMEVQSHDPVEPTNAINGWKSFLSKAYLMGVGMATGAYDMSVINYVNLVLTDLYSLTAWESSLIVTAGLIGTFCGQLIFGLLGDKIGRKRASVITCSLLIIGSSCSGLLVFDIKDMLSVLALMLAFWRVLLGTGIGGEYPVTAIFTGENSAKADKRGTYISAMFSSQGIGNVCAACTFLALLLIIPNMNFVWRAALILGSVPATLILIPRLRMQETKEFRTTAQYKVSVVKTLKVCWRRLIGTAGSWFLFDIVFYGNSLFSGPILQAVGITSTGYSGIVGNVAFNVLITFIALPGYWFATAMIDRVGRRPLQLFGFLMMAVIYILIAFFYDFLVKYTVLFVICYGLSYFFGNSPNTTTFVIPTETYPAVVRSTCHGLSAASGKFGAILGSFFLNPLLDATGPQAIFLICGCISVVGFVVTFFFVEETKNTDLEKLNEDLTPMLINSPATSINV